MAYNPEYHKEYYQKNKEKKKAASREWKKNNPDKARSYRKNERDLRYKRLFGISLDDYEQMLKQQNNLCAICKNTENNKLLAVDHCHNTGKVRGLLCSKCNQGLGLFKDNVSFLSMAILYVQRNTGS